MDETLDTIQACVYVIVFVIWGISAMVMHHEVEVTEYDHLAISEEMMAPFFAQFDTNENGQLDCNEAEYFFFTVEKNVKYRYDNENEADTDSNDRIGDARPGSNYYQLPLETFIERRGDCDDVAMLQTAFYNYYGFEAYVALVDTDGGKYSNHAISIVNIENHEDWPDILGHPVHTYNMSYGYFLLVDNTYSRDFGAVYYDGEYQSLEGRFRIHERLTIEEAAAKHSDQRRPFTSYPGLDHWVLPDDDYMPYFLRNDNSSHDEPQNETNPIDEITDNRGFGDHLEKISENITRFPEQ
jgi:hypothetical protein